QAEDGIRDFHVTGVQTCALRSVSRRSTATRSGGGLRRVGSIFDLNPGAVQLGCRSREERQGTIVPMRLLRNTGTNEYYRRCPGRSEERRVGKECRARWAADGQR